MNQCNRFRNATVLYFVFHQDKVDASFCGRMFHPPLLAVIVSFFSSVKSGISIQLVAIVDQISIYVLRSLLGLPHELFQILVLKGQYRLSVPTFVRINY